MAQTLEQLKDKWFLRIGDDGIAYPPTDRPFVSRVAVSTDGNTVVPQIDGQQYMGEWHRQVNQLIGSSGERELFHFGWRLQNVPVLGSRKPPGALDHLIAAHRAGVKVHALLSDHLTDFHNAPAQDELEDEDLTTVSLDDRFPPRGSNHQKATVFKGPSGAAALVGSFDLAFNRWDTPGHRDFEPDRVAGRSAPTHDAGVLITGPAVADVEHTFRERWNDESNRWGMDPEQPPITSPVAAPPPTGTSSVQVLRTYGRTRDDAYSWSPQGEFTAWAAWLKAVRTAQRYIYIEDQYFLPFGLLPYCLVGGNAFQVLTDPISELGKVLADETRGVDVVVVTPSSSEDVTRGLQDTYRDLAAQHLYAADAGRGRFTIASLEKDQRSVYVHSKLLIVDDEYVWIGSTNVCQRSMTCDSELSVGIVDAQKPVARDLRTALWAEHLEATPAERADVQDVTKGIAMLRRAKGRVRPYPYAPPGKLAGTALGKALYKAMPTIDPYTGP